MSIDSNITNNDNINIFVSDSNILGSDSTQSLPDVNQTYIYRNVNHQIELLDSSLGSVDLEGPVDLEVKKIGLIRKGINGFGNLVNKGVNGLKHRIINAFLPESFINDTISIQNRDAMGNVLEGIQLKRRSEIRHTNASKVAYLEKNVGLTSSKAELNEFLYLNKKEEYSKNDRVMLKNDLADVYMMKQGETRQSALIEAERLLEWVSNASEKNFQDSHIYSEIKGRSKKVLEMINREIDPVSEKTLSTRALQASLNKKEITAKLNKLNKLLSSDEELEKYNAGRVKHGMKPVSRQNILNMYNNLFPEKASIIKRTKHLVMNDLRNAWNIGAVVARTPMALAQVPMNAINMMNSGPEKLITSVLGTAGLVAKPFIAITAFTAIIAGRILGKVAKLGLYAAAATAVAAGLGTLIVGAAVGVATVIVPLKITSYFAGPTVGKIYDKSLSKSIAKNMYIELNQKKVDLQKLAAYGISRKDPRFGEAQQVIQTLNIEIQRLEKVLKTLGAKIPKIPTDETKEILRHLMIHLKEQDNTIEGLKAQSTDSFVNVNLIDDTLNSSSDITIENSDNIIDSDNVIDNISKEINSVKGLIILSEGAINDNGSIDDVLKNQSRGRIAGVFRKGYKKLNSDKVKASNNYEIINSDIDNTFLNNNEAIDNIPLENTDKKTIFQRIKGIGQKIISKLPSKKREELIVQQEA